MAETPRSPSLSSSAFASLTALRRAELMGARGVFRADDGDDYPDFSVEGSGPPWHEAFTDVITGDVLRTEAQFSADRMAFVDRIRAAADDGYDDFFVENGGDGKPWHEAFADAGSDRERLVSDPRPRAAALASVNVVRSYLQLRGDALGR
jgi:hypothetical protein